MRPQSWVSLNRGSGRKPRQKELNKRRVPETAGRRSGGRVVRPADGQLSLPVSFPACKDELIKPAFISM
ncbi:hypothetical protein MHYP_G00323580 [Metynnis hypsauchen]